MSDKQLRADVLDELAFELKMDPLLTGYRGSPPRDVGAFQAAIARVGMMVDALPQIAELDLNPIVVHSTGVTVVDARIRVAAASAPPRLPARR